MNKWFKLTLMLLLISGIGYSQSEKVYWLANEPDSKLSAAEVLSLAEFAENLYAGTIVVNNMEIDSLEVNYLLEEGTYAAGGSSIYINDVYTQIDAVAYKSILSELTYTPQTAEADAPGTACPIAIVGKVNLDGNLTDAAGRQYPGMGWGVQGQINIAHGTTIDGGNYTAEPGAVYAGLRGVVTDDGTANYTKGFLTGLYAETQLSQSNANVGGDFNIYIAWLRQQGLGNVAAGLYIDAHGSFPNTILKGIDMEDVVEGIEIDATTVGIDINSTSNNAFTGISINATTTEDDYNRQIFSEWTAGADMTSGGSDGIYAIAHPDEDVENAYALRGRMHLVDATGRVDVNQLHAVDALINLNETQLYDVVDNLSVFGGAIHGAGAGDVTNDTGDGSMNIFYGVMGPTVLKNFSITTNGMLLMAHPATYLDYGVNIENSGTMIAGLLLNNHLSDSEATMTAGIKMISAASKMTYGVDMSAAGISTAEILGTQGETWENVTADGVWTTDGGIAVASGMDLGSSQALVGAVAMTIGSGGQTVNINSSDWDIDATGNMTNMGTYGGDGLMTLTTVLIGLNIDGTSDGTDANFMAADIDYTQGTISSNELWTRGNITGVKTLVTAKGNIDHVYGLRSDAELAMTAHTQTNQFYGAMVSAKAEGNYDLVLEDGLVGLQATVEINADVNSVTGGLVAALFTNSQPIAQNVVSPTYNIFAKVGGYTDYGIAVQVESNNVASGIRIQAYDNAILDTGLEISIDPEGGTIKTDIELSSGAKIFTGSAVDGNAIYAQVGAYDAVGSIYLSTTGTLWVQDTDGGSGLDWEVVSVTETD